LSSSKILILIGLSLAVLAGGRVALACDPCAFYNLSRLQGTHEQSLTLSLSEQYSSFRLANPERLPREGSRTRSFSTTHLSVGYDISDRIGVQLSVPYVYTSSDRIERFARVSKNSDSGFGDLALIGQFSLYQDLQAESATLAGLSFGVKFPTGDTGSLGEFRSDLDSSSTVLPLRHHNPAGGLGGGRLLSLGTGSYDFIFGGNLLRRQGRFLVMGYAQYVHRTEGDFDYRFADDFIWSVGPGYYLHLDHEESVVFRLALGGEHKGMDRLNSQKVQGSRVSNIFISPEFIVSFAGGYVFELGVDLPAYRGSDSALSETRYRVRSALSYRFS